MNCAELKRTVELEDDDRRPDVAALRAHFTRCEDCQAEFPELALLLPNPRASRIGRSGWRIAIAAALLLGATLALRARAPEPVVETPTAATPAGSRRLAYTLVVTTTVVERERITTSTLTHQTHPASAPNP